MVTLRYTLTLTPGKLQAHDIDVRHHSCSDVSDYFLPILRIPQIVRTSWSALFENTDRVSENDFQCNLTKR